MNSEQLPQTVAEYVRATNDHDPAAFIALFADNAVVNDAGREFRGLDAIKAWSDRDIFKPQVTLEVMRFADGGDEVVLTTNVDGNFDRTGLPDPVIINHHIRAAGRIVSLVCCLAETAKAKDPALVTGQLDGK